MKQVRILPFYRTMAQRLLPHWGVLLVAAFLIDLPMWPVTYFSLPWYVGLVAFAVTGVLQLGLTYMLLNAYRGQPVSLKMILGRCACTNTVVCYYAMLLGVVLLSMLASAIVMMPVLMMSSQRIAALPKGMTQAMSQELFNIANVEAIVMLVVTLVMMTAITLRFTLTMPLVADKPEMRFRDALSISTLLLKGNKRTLLKVVVPTSLLIEAVVVLLTLLVIGAENLGVAPDILRAVNSIINMAVTAVVQLIALATSVQIYLLIRREISVD